MIGDERCITTVKIIKKHHYKDIEVKPMSGQILGDRYEIEKQLGKQAGRWTLLGRDMQTQAQVVVKLLFKDDLMTAEDLKLFEREVKILQSISHPCIPRYLDYFEQELPTTKALALVQAFVPGKSLQEIIAQGRVFSETETKQIAKVLLKILEHLHSQITPVIHRDIKPSNVVIGLDKRPYLIDFGSVKTMINQDTSAYTMVGTYGYMPPEQFGGRAVIASDLYSLGTTMISLVTGKEPSALPRKGTRFDLEAVVDLSPAFADWLYWMTEIAIDRRLQSATESIRVLDAGQVRGSL
jgi:eukaryotic-like serine/threonine-protein kinase